MIETEEKVVKCEIQLDRIFFPKGVHKVESGEYAIFSADVVNPIENCDDLYSNWGKATIKLKGNVCSLETYVTYKVTCRLADRHEQFGDTYEILFISKKVDLSNKSQQIDFLEGIINPNVVHKLFEKYDDVVTLLEDKDIKSLTSISGIGHATAMRIIQEYEDSKDYSEIYTELSDLSLTPNLIKRLLDYYQSPTLVVEKIKSNPYELVEVDGIGFKKADEIANKLGLTGTDPRRIKAAILHTLNENGEKGKSFLHFSELMDIVYNQIGFVEDRIMGEVAKNLVDSGLINVSGDGQFIGLKRYYDLEMNIYKELLRLQDAESKIEVREDWKKIIAETQLNQGFNFTDEQLETIEKVLSENVIAVTGNAGCVDKDTEFFNGYTWKKISEYADGDMVLQYDENGKAELVKPIKFIKLPEETLTLIKTKNGCINQCLSDEHTVVYKTSKGNLAKLSFDEVKRRHEYNECGFNGRFMTTFKFDGEGIHLTDEQIRVMVMVIADGTFPNESDNYCNVNLKKKRKKDRLVRLLNAAKIPYRTCEKLNGNTLYSFYAPEKEKYYGDNWYKCTQDQLRVVTDEVLYWDGSICNGRLSFSTHVKETADFVQFAFSATGKRAIIGINDRVGQKYKDHKYVRKTIEYYVKITQRSPEVSLIARSKDKKTKFETFTTKDGFKYCFTLPSGMWVMRRENRIAITGNCGKTSTINGAVKVLSEYDIRATALSGKASVRITEATGIDACTIHRLLGYQHGKFEFNEKRQLNADVVILDEATMVNGTLFLSLLKAIPSGAKLLMLGDHQQLTPIGNCQVFTDILETETLPTMKLTKIHRQAEASGIIPTSIKITNQEQIFNSSFEDNTILGELKDMEMDIYKKDESPDQRVINHFLKQYELTNDVMETQVLSPVKMRGDLSTYNLNTKIQQIINPVREDDDYIEVKIKDKSKQPKFYKLKVGDKVINTVNNYKTIDVEGKVTPVFNGNMGIIKEIDNGSCVVDFIGVGELLLNRDAIKNLELGYAISIHKSQGSGFHTAIVAIESAAYMLLNAELLYTGITRAKKYCVLVGQNSAVRTSISKREVKNKQTYLKYFLSNE